MDLLNLTLEDLLRKWTLLPTALENPLDLDWILKELQKNSDSEDHRHKSLKEPSRIWMSKGFQWPFRSFNPPVFMLEAHPNGLLNLLHPNINRCNILKLITLWRLQWAPWNTPHLPDKSHPPIPHHQQQLLLQQVQQPYPLVQTWQAWPVLLNHPPTLRPILPHRRQTLPLPMLVQYQHWIVAAQ